jgi:hypothetical protein
VGRDVFGTLSLLTTIRFHEIIWLWLRVDVAAVAVVCLHCALVLLLFRLCLLVFFFSLLVRLFPAKNKRINCHRG